MQDSQLQLYNAILHKSSDNLDNITSPHRLNIYRNNVLETLRNALYIIFPHLWSLVGEECANNLALSFAEFHLPTTAILDTWGEDFIIFIAKHPALSSLPYASDVCRYDWIFHKLRISADPTTPKVLAKADALDFSIILQHSIELFRSEYPIKDILALIENPALPEVNLNQGASYALLYRKGFTTHTLWIDSIEYEWLNTLAKQKTLLATQETVCLSEEKLQGILEKLFAEEIVQEFY